MESLFDLARLEAWYAQGLAWLQVNVLVKGNLVQLLVIALAAALAWRAAPPTQRLIGSLRQRVTAGGRAARTLRGAQLIVLPIIWLALQWIAVLTARGAQWPHQILTITASLLSAWVVIRVAATLVRDPGWGKLVSVTAWTIAALNILGLLGPTVALLDSIGVHFGELRISALTIVKAVLSLAVLLWIATVASGVFEQRIKSLPNLTPSVQVLFSKLLKVILLTIAFVAALSSVGIDLTAFTVFSGAIGVGVGFGLQKIVSNLISGVILLIDKSIKPGDVISVGDEYGWVNSLGARYVSVVTRDGTEHLIPNEELITQRVENWSYSNNLVRLRAPVGVHYKSDVRHAISLCIEAARATPRVLQDPAPVCLLKGFGDSSVDLEIRFWIQDPAEGMSNVLSEVLLRVWDRFHEEGVEIPYPQRDLHIRTPAPAPAADPG